MLNELYHLSVVLESLSIKPFQWHDDLKQLPSVSYKKPCFRISINPDCSIAGIEAIKQELVAVLRKWEPSNGNSFPGFNIQPLYRIADEDKKKHIKTWKDGKEPIDLVLLKKWCAGEKVRNWNTKTIKKMYKCLRVIPRELQENCIHIPSDFAAFKNLLERITKLGDDPAAQLFQLLDGYIWRVLNKYNTDLSLLHVLLHEGSSKRNPEDDRGSVSVFLDVPDWQEYPVANEKTIKAINAELLNSTKSLCMETGSESNDVFGRSIMGINGKLPEVKLPILGAVKLRAMTSESPCQYRYGTIDEASYVIGEDSRKRAKGALEWLCDDAREGETWGRVDMKEILFTYPTVIPRRLPKLTACFGARKVDDTKTRFESYAKDIVNCLKGLAPSLKDIDLRVFSLRKMDKARTKVVFHRNYSAQRLADAATDWQRGCTNIPAIQIKLWSKGKGETTMVGPETPFPLQIAVCLNRHWKLDGTSPSEINAISNTTGIELLLDESAVQRRVAHLLAVALQNGKGLFLSLCNRQHRDGPDDVLKLSGFNQHTQLMPSILGLLLWKIGIGKECYMNDFPYLVGRILKIADELHAVYCKELRKNNLPSQLLGNALMVAALESPTQALAQLALRIIPYVGWARTNTTASAGLSRYFLKEFSLIEAKLREITFPARLDDAGRAQLLLGYLSGNPQNEKVTNH